MWMVVWGLDILLRNCISNAQPTGQQMSRIDPACPVQCSQHMGISHSTGMAHTSALMHSQLPFGPYQPA